VGEAIAAVRELRGKRARLRATARALREDPCAFFPAWYRRARPASLRGRPIFLPVDWAEGRVRGADGPLHIVGVGAGLPQYFLNGAMWRAVPALRTLAPFASEQGPTLVDRIERGVLEATRRVSRVARDGAPTPLLSLNQWIELARATPGSLSLLPDDGELARTCVRLAADHGLDALRVSEALRLPEFREFSRGPRNDLLGEIPERLEEYLALEPLFVDGESIDVLHAMLQYRMTRELGSMEAVARHPACQYLPAELYALHDRERFYDIGAYTGDSLTQFLNATDGRFEGAICLEPDPHNFYFLRKNLASLPEATRQRVRCLELGAWRTEGELRFHATSTTGSSMAEEGSQGRVVTVRVTTIDALSERHGPPTLIKCEAEGADRHVVEGARRTLAAHRPRMAVTAYHLPDDLLALAPMLKEANADYRLALRQYQPHHLTTTIHAW
jgi:FkbM family methyltransferase